MLMSGVVILVVSRRLGHIRVSTTLDIYGHFIPGMQDEAVMRIGSKVGQEHEYEAGQNWLYHTSVV